ncbi:MAG: hypothetical protein GY810_31740, partial [Aureispira sp.]|nr:hypothetical protein [Aureispira sp.]
MKKNKVLVAGSFGTLVLILVVASYLLIDKRQLDVQSPATIKKQPLQNEAEYTEAFNQAINRAEEDHKKYLEYAETEEGKQASESYWNKMLSIAKGRSKD